MASSLLSPATLLILGGLTCSVLGIQEVGRQHSQYIQAKANLAAAQARSEQQKRLLESNARLIDEMAKMTSPPGVSADQKRPVQERIAALVSNLRAAEAPTRTRVTRLQAGPTATNAGDRAVATLAEPLPSLPGAAVININVDGNYLSLSQLTEYLSVARNAGAAISSLSINDMQFKATFSIYARV